VYLPRGPRRPGDLYHNGHFIKRVNLADKAELRKVSMILRQSSLKIKEDLNC
jgi:hypothetical protein